MTPVADNCLQTIRNHYNPTHIIVYIILHFPLQSVFFELHGSNGKMATRIITVIMLYTYV